MDVTILSSSKGLSISSIPGPKRPGGIFDLRVVAATIPFIFSSCVDLVFASRARLLQRGGFMPVWKQKACWVHFE